MLTIFPIKKTQKWHSSQITISKQTLKNVNSKYFTIQKLKILVIYIQEVPIGTPKSEFLSWTFEILVSVWFFIAHLLLFRIWKILILRGQNRRSKFSKIAQNRVLFFLYFFKLTFWWVLKPFVSIYWSNQLILIHNSVCKCVLR